MNESKRADRIVACKTVLVAKATAKVAEEVAQELEVTDPVNVEEGFANLISKAEVIQVAKEEPQPVKRKRKGRTKS